MLFTFRSLAFECCNIALVINSGFALCIGEQGFIQDFLFGGGEIIHMLGNHAIRTRAP